MIFFLASAGGRVNHLAMKHCAYIPSSLRAAGKQLRPALAGQLESLSKPAFIRAWNSVSYLFPGLHPDGYHSAECGWPRALRRIAAEAWRRADSGEISDDELYPSDAQWAGLYDRMNRHSDEETAHRLELAKS